MNYTHAEFVNALRECGISKGDVVFNHSNIGFFGMPEGAKNATDTCRIITSAIFEVIGESGTFVVPTFTYSFGSDKVEKVFDIENSSSGMGIFAEYIRKLPEAKRSADPMFSVAAVGKKAEELTKNISTECFGKDSFWDRFYKFGGKICNFNFDSGSTFIHYVEKCLNVPYRKNYKFSGKINGQEKTFIYFARDLESKTAYPRFERFDQLAKQKYSKTAKLGRGEIVMITATDTYNLIKDTLDKEPDFLTEAGAKNAG